MGLTVYGGGGKPEEEKTVTAGTSVIEVSPSSGKVMKKVTVNPTPTESKNVTPTTSELTVTPSEGKHLSQVIVGAIEDVTPEVTAQTPVITQILEGLVGKAQGANATADKILEGYSAYVGQVLLEGTAKDLSSLAEMCGFTKIEIDTLILTSDTNSLDIYHNFETTPQVLLIFAKSRPSTIHIGRVALLTRGETGSYAEGSYTVMYNGKNSDTMTSGFSCSVYDTKFSISINSYNFLAGLEYTIITMA